MKKAAPKKTSVPKSYAHDVSVCINKIIKDAKKSDPSIDGIEFECSTIQRFRAKPTRYKTGQPIKIYLKTITGKQKTKTSFVAHSFCPFCGKKF